MYNPEAEAWARRVAVRYPGVRCGLIAASLAKMFQPQLFFLWPRPIVQNIFRKYRPAAWLSTALSILISLFNTVYQYHYHHYQHHHASQSSRRRW